jgi:hypothetical protein
MTILAVGVLGTLGMFHAGYNNVGEGGRTTMALAAARQMIEDVHTVPYAELTILNNFDTNTPPGPTTSVIGLAVARKWRYALAGEGGGWTFTTAEKQQWTKLMSGVGSGTTVAGKGQISVDNAPGTVAGTVLRVTVTVRVPSNGRTTRLVAYISRP